MSGKKPSLLEKEISTFEYTNQACSVYVNSNAFEGIRHLGQKKHTFLFSSQDSLSPIEMKCSIRKGLILKEQTKAARTVTSLFLSINEDPNSFLSFTEKYGPLFPVDTANPFTIDYEDVLAIKKRLESVFSLIPLLNEHAKNYSQILEHVLYLLTGPSVSLSGIGFQYESCTYPEIMSGYKIPKSNRIFSEDDDFKFHKEKYLDERILIDIIEGEYPENKKQAARTVASLLDVYLNYEGPNETRLIIDFLYNYAQSVIDNDSNSFELSPNLKDALLKIAEYLVRTEISHNIQGISITCSPMPFSMAYSIPSLLSAMYWSILFLKDRDVYKVCPECGDYFVPTNLHQVYCSRACGNVRSQRNHRNRMKMEQEESSNLCNNQTLQTVLPVIQLKEYAPSPNDESDDDLPF